MHIRQERTTMQTHHNIHAVVMRAALALRVRTDVHVCLLFSLLVCGFARVQLLCVAFFPSATLGDFPACRATDSVCSGSTSTPTIPSRLRWNYLLRRHSWRVDDRWGPIAAVEPMRRHFNTSRSITLSVPRLRWACVLIQVRC
jgi:hypothetical protein